MCQFLNPGLFSFWEGCNDTSAISSSSIFPFKIFTASFISKDWDMWCSETHIYKGNKHWFQSKQIKYVLAVADTGLSPSFVINEALWRLFINIIIFLRSLLACCSPHWWIWQQQSPCESVCSGVSSWSHSICFSCSYATHPTAHLGAPGFEDT